MSFRPQTALTTREMFLASYSNIPDPCVPPPANALIAFALLACVSCSKEPVPVQRTFTAQELNELSDAFDPEPNEITGLLRHFEEQKLRYAEGSREELGKRPLSEALWACEADLNHMRGDARVVRDTTGHDSIIFVLPFEVDAAGAMMVDDEDLILKQQELLAQIPLDATVNPIQFIDVSLREIVGSDATFAAGIYKRYVPYDVLTPPPTGCFYMELNGDYPAEDVMNAWIEYNFYTDLNIDPTFFYDRPFYTSVSTQKVLSTIDGYGILNNYVTYLGTEANLGGPDWLESDASFTQVCFPDYWNRHLALKQWYFDQYLYTPGRVLVEQRYETWYSPRIGGPMAYGSAYYPMGPYDHLFYFKKGVLVRTAG